MRIFKGLLAALIMASALTATLPAQADEPGRYGSLWLGPRIGAGIGFKGPRAGYLVGLELSYRTPYYFYYSIEVGFLHLLPRTIDIDATSSDDGTELVPAHEATATGLYGIPITLEIGLRYAVGRARLRLGVGFGAMVSIQNVEAFGTDETELITSFCFRPGLGVDIVARDGDGLFRIDLMYLWQDAAFQSTGSDRDVDSLMITFGYSWQVAGSESSNE